MSHLSLPQPGGNFSSRQSRFFLHSGQTRSPIQLLAKILRHLRHRRCLASYSRSGFGLLSYEGYIPYRTR
jgi:hypothetical protein